MQLESIIYNVTEEEILAKYESRIRDWARRMDYSLRDDLAQAARISLLKAWRDKGAAANDAYLRSAIFTAMQMMMRTEYRRRRLELDEELSPPDPAAPANSESRISLGDSLREYSPLEIDIAMASGGGWGVHDIARMFRMKTDRVRAALRKIRGGRVHSEE
jgi:hypothetical protein